MLGFTTLLASTMLVPFFQTPPVCAPRNSVARSNDVRLLQIDNVESAPAFAWAWIVIGAEAVNAGQVFVAGIEYTTEYVPGELVFKLITPVEVFRASPAIGGKEPPLVPVMVTVAVPRSQYGEPAYEMLAFGIGVSVTETTDE